MQSSAVATLVSPLSPEQRRALLSDPALRTLQGAFTAVPDPRSPLGRRYPLPFLLTCLVAALLCGCNSLDAVGQWCTEQRRLLRRVFGLQRHLTPTGALYRWVLPQLDAERVEWILAAWTQGTLPATGPAEPLVADGKAVRGASTASTPAPHLLSISTAYSQETLLQAQVDAKTNEIPVLQELLPYLPVAGRVVLADALHTQVETATQLRAQGGDYVFIVKGNQPSLQAALAEYFTDPEARCATAETTDLARGRREERCLKVTTALTRYLAASWPGLAQVGQLTRTVTGPGLARQETVYLITSLPRAKARVKRLLALVRAYWSIENKRHYVRDVVFGEDRSRLRTGAAPQIMAALRNLVLTLIHRHGCADVTHTRRHFMHHPARALALLLPARPTP